MVNVIDWSNIDYQWNVIADFEVEHTIIDNKISVKIKNEDLIGASFLLNISVNSIIMSKTKINIIE